MQYSEGRHEREDQACNMYALYAWNCHGIWQAPLGRGTTISGINVSADAWTEMTTMTSCTVLHEKSLFRDARERKILVDHFCFPIRNILCLTLL